jgi:site-specific DNA-methyltransferase (adenine-specific)
MLEQHGINIYNRDCLDAMREMPDNAFDLAIVDPPYGIGAGEDARQGVKFKASATKRKDYGNKDWDKITPGINYFQEVLRVSKDQIIWGVNYYAIDLLAGGRVFWDKDTAEDYTNSDGELAFCSKINSVKKVKIRWNGMLQHDMANKENRIHPTQKPVALYKWLLDKYAKEGDKILDTHLGSGSIAIACYEYGFNLTGFELDPDYFNAAKQRVENHIQSHPKLF